MWKSSCFVDAPVLCLLSSFQLNTQTLMQLHPYLCVCGLNLLLFVMCAYLYPVYINRKNHGDDAPYSHSVRWHPPQLQNAPAGTPHSWRQRWCDSGNMSTLPTTETQRANNPQCYSYNLLFHFEEIFRFSKRYSFCSRIQVMKKLWVLSYESGAINRFSK